MSSSALALEVMGESGHRDLISRLPTTGFGCQGRKGFPAWQFSMSHCRASSVPAAGVSFSRFGITTASPDGHGVDFCLISVPRDGTVNKISRITDNHGCCIVTLPDKLPHQAAKARSAFLDDRNQDENTMRSLTPMV